MMKLLVACVLLGVACSSFPLNMIHQVSPTQQFRLGNLMPGKAPEAPLDMNQNVNTDMLMGINRTIAGGGRESFFQAVRYIRNDTLVAERIDATAYFVQTQPPMTIVNSVVNWHDFSYTIVQDSNGNVGCKVGNPDIQPDLTDFEFKGITFLSYDKNFVFTLGAARLVNIYSAKQGSSNVDIISDVYTNKPVAYFSSNSTSSTHVEISGYYMKYDTRPGVANQEQFTISAHLDCEHESESMYEKEAHHLLGHHQNVPSMMRPHH